MAYYTSGTVAEKGYYQLGQKTTAWISCFRNSQIASEGIYWRNDKNEKWSIYHDNRIAQKVVVFFSRGIPDKGDIFIIKMDNYSNLQIISMVYK